MERQETHFPLSKKALFVYSVLILINIVLFSVTDPLKSSVLVIITGFLVISVDIVVLTYLVLRMLGTVIPYVRTRLRRLSAVFAGFGIVLLALSSIGQLTWRDVLAVLAVAAVAYFYSMYFRIRSRRAE